MKSKTIMKAALITVAAGAVLTGVGLALGSMPGFYIDKRGIHPEWEMRIPVNQEKISIDKLKNIQIDLSGVDVHLIPSEEFAVEYSLPTHVQEPDLKGESLDFQLKNKKVMKIASFDFGFLMGNEQPEYVNIYYPEETEFDRVELKVRDGEITTGDIKAQYVDIQNKYNDVETGNIEAETLVLELNDCSAEAGNITASEMQVKALYGDFFRCKSAEAERVSLIFEQCQGEVQEIKADTFTGRFKYADFKAEKVSCAEGSMDFEDGDIEIKRADLGICDINSDYGDVELGLTDWKSCGLDLSTKYGSVTIPGMGELEKESGGAAYRQRGSSGSDIVIVCDDGDIIID